LGKLLVALVTSAFAFVSVLALADDTTRAEPVDQTKTEIEAAKAKAAAMTPEEKAAAKKAKRVERQKQLSQEALDSKPKPAAVGDFGPLGGWPEQKARRDAIEKKRAAKKQMDKGSDQ